MERESPAGNRSIVINSTPGRASDAAARRLFYAGARFPRAAAWSTRKSTCFARDRRDNKNRPLVQKRPISASVYQSSLSLSLSFSCLAFAKESRRKNAALPGTRYMRTHPCEEAGWVISSHFAENKRVDTYVHVDVRKSRRERERVICSGNIPRR